MAERVNRIGRKPTGIFDAGTNAAVVSFQRTHQLVPDGVVGPLTRIVLYRTAGRYPRPMLALRSQGPA